MAVTLPQDAIDPLVRKIGEVAGLLSIGDSPSVRDEFLAHPLDELANALKERQDEVIELLSLILGDSNAEVLGMPAGGTEDHWLPIRGPDGKPTGLYIVLTRKAPSLIVGLGWKWETTENRVTVRTWAHVPMLKTAGSGPTTELAVATDEAPVRIAAEVVLDGGFGADGLQFRGVRGVVSVKGASAPPDVALVLLGLQLGDGPVQDRSLADLASLSATTWIETAVALFTAQLSQAGAGSAANLVKDYVLPLLGVTAPAPMVRLKWEELPQKRSAVFDEWFNAMASSPVAMRAWLGKWQGLLQGGAGIPLAANIVGKGTRADPWRADVPVAGGVKLSPTAAVETRADGVRILYLGFRVGSTPFSIGASTLRLDLTGSTEIVAIPIGSSAPVQGLPSLSVLLRLASTTGTLVTHNFPAGDPLAALGTLAVGSLEAGLVLDAERHPVPHVAMRDVQCARGTWAVIDLSSADAVLDGLGAVASNLIQQQIEQGLALASAGPHAGRRVAALFGLTAPTAGGAPVAWPVTLATDAARITQFLGNPLAAVARYHSDCLTTDIGGAPAWRFLFAELGDLLREMGAGTVQFAGTGTSSNPWRQVLGRTDAGDVLVRAHFSLEAARPQLHFVVAFEPRSLPIDDAALALSISAELFHADLPAPTSTDAPTATWLPDMRAELLLARASGLETPSLSGLRIGADALSLALQWSPSDGADWVLDVREPWAAWDGAGTGVLMLPPLQLNRTGIPSWNLVAPDLGGALGTVQRDAVAELSRFVVGHLALEHGGPIGFGLSALFGLLPADPEIELSAWRGGDPGFSLPADFPVLQPADWGEFFADPWPTLRAHIARLFVEPRFTKPLLQWLRAALQGLAPQRGGGAELLTFEEAIRGAGLFTPPDGIAEPERGNADPPLEFPTLESLPITVGGNGTYDSPYTIGLRGATARGVDALVWLDPDGPPAASAVNAAIATLAPALRDLSQLDGAGLEQLLEVLSSLSRVDEALARALEGITPATFAASLVQLETFLNTSDGVVLTASQQPADPTWTKPPVLDADHTHQLAAPTVVSAIQTQIAAWDGGADLPVLVLCAPFERNAASSALTAALGGTSSLFTYRVAGTSPNAVSLLTLTGASRVTAAELAVYDDASGLTATERLVPMDGPAGASSQAEQVVRLLERVRALNPGKQVIVVAHSSSGLAARAAVQRAGLAGAVRGVITVGTPHVGSALPWAGNPSVSEAVGALQRMATSLSLGAPVKPALDALWQFLRGRDLSDTPLRWPAHAFAPSGPMALPSGVGGLALATRLPVTGLRQAVATAIAERAGQLRTALAGRAPVHHIGVGISLAPRSGSDATLDVQVRARIDIAQIRVADGDAVRSVPRLVISAVLKRRDSWLVGTPDSRVRVRWAEIGCDVTPDAVTPRVRLHDAAVDGVEQIMPALHLLPDGGWQPDDILVSALDAVLAELTAAPGANADVMALARLLSSFDVTKLRGATEDGGYAINPDGWSALLADGRAAMSRVLATVLADVTKRSALIARLRAVFGFSGTDLSRLLGDDIADPPEWRVLRSLLRAVDLLDAEDRGSAPIIASWLALVESPAEYLRTHIAPLVRDAARRADLLSELRAILNVRDVGTPVVEIALGGGVNIRVESLGRVSLRIADAAQLPLGGALSLSGAFELDLANGSADISLRLQPAAITSALRWQLVIPTGAGAITSDLALDLSDGASASPLDALPIFPVPADFPTRLGALLPRVMVSTISTALLDALVLARVPELARPLAFLGLVDTPSGGRPRFRNLSRLIADPPGWLVSPSALGNNTGTQLDPTRVAGLVREVATTFHLADGSGTIVLPYGMRLTTAIAPAARVALAMPSPLALDAGVTIAIDAALGWTATGVLGAGGSIDLRAAMPGGGSWPTLRVQLGVEDGALRVALGADDAMLQLLPFTGFGADALGAAASRLLPTLLDALLDALQANGNADVAAFVTRVRTAATTLEADTLPRLDALVDDPIAWVRRRFSAANAPASASALGDVLTGVPGFTVVSGKLQFKPGGSPVAVTVGRNGVIGAGIVLTDLDLGPATMAASFSVGLTDSGPVAPVVVGALVASVDDGVIAPAGVSIRPSVHLGIGTSGVTFHLYPIGNVTGSPDFRLDILPAFTFGVDDGGTIEGALLELARRVLVPVVIETFLDTADVTTWLNTDLHPGLRPGGVLSDAGLLVSDGGGGWNLVPIDTLANPKRLVEGLIGAALRTTSVAFGATPIIDFSGEAGPGAGVFAANAVDGAATTYGLRVALAELRLSEDPEIVVRLGGRSDWIAPAGGPAGVGAGLSFLAVRDNGVTANPRFAFDPMLELAGVGIHVSGRVDEPLFDVNGFRLGGLEALLYLRVSSLLTTPQIKFGLYGDISKIAIPLGTSDSNPVAASLMSGGGDSGDNQPVNPEFSVRAAYVENLWVEIGGERRDEVWFPIQRTFGPVSIQQIGVRWIGGPASKLAVLLDGGVALAGLAVGVDDLSLTMPLARISHTEEWELGLRGLAISYNAGGVKIAGGLLQASDEIRYDGFVLIEVAGRSFVAFGSYGVVEGDTSLFVFLVVAIPIGGPPYFFITGLAGGFGYNRGLTVPPVESVPAFPLVSAMSDPGVITDDPMGFLRELGPSFPMERGSYWFAAGLKFTSFTLVNSQALLYVLLNRGLEIGILGMSQMELPPAAPLVSVELALKARFSTVEGLISVEARLTDNSWLLSRDCRLTGGFAFFLWFAGEHAGDFVICIGGYHPRYTKPAHYPAVPRLGFNWRVGSSITIKGEAYFALTPREVMAGGLLEAVYKHGDIRAWFHAWANMYIQWRPFWFDVDIGITVGIAVDTWFGTARAETGASLWLWGPDIGGEVTVDLWIVSFTIGFGARYNKPSEALSWGQFRTTLLPLEDDKLYGGNVERGLITGSPATGPWTVLPEFVLRTDVFLGTAGVKFGVATETAGGAPVQIDIRPMKTPVNITSIHKVRVVRVRDEQDQTERFQLKQVLRGNVARALWDTDASNPSQSVMPGITGSRLVAEFDATRLDSTGSIPWTKLFETGRRHPLPFVPELDERALVENPARIALDLDALAVRSDDALLAAHVILQDGAWRERKTITLGALAAEGVRVTPSERNGDVTPRGTFRRGRRSSPPLVRSLYEGLAGEATLSAAREETHPEPPPAPAVVPMHATLDAVIRQRAEPTRAMARSVRTTVNASQFGGRAETANMQALLDAPIPGTTVVMQAPAQGARESTIAKSMKTLRRGLGTAGADIAILEELEKAAWTTATLTTHADDTGLSTRSVGAPVDPGSTLRFTLPTRDVDRLPPELHIDGDSAMRITALDRGGNPLLDIESVGALRIAIPEGAATLTVCGLGSSSQKEASHELGAVSLREATSPVPVVGWQSQSELVVAGPTTLLARGALVTLASSITKLGDAGTVIASVAIADQLGVTTTLPIAVRSIAVVLDEVDDACVSSVADTLAISAEGAVLSDVPKVVASGHRTVLLYDVIATDRDARVIAIPVACNAAWTLCGVMGFNDSATRWATLLATTDLDALVENGPLAPTGAASLRFVHRNPPPQ